MWAVVYLADAPADGGSTVSCTSLRSDGVARPAVTIDENDVGISG